MAHLGKRTRQTLTAVSGIGVKVIFRRHFLNLEDRHGKQNEKRKMDGSNLEKNRK